MLEKASNRLEKSKKIITYRKAAIINVILGFASVFPLFMALILTQGIFSPPNESEIFKGRLIYIILIFIVLISNGSIFVFRNKDKTKKLKLLLTSITFFILGFGVFVFMFYLKVKF